MTRESSKTTRGKAEHATLRLLSRRAAGIGATTAGAPATAPAS